MLRTIMQALLLATTICLFACDSSTETANTSEPPGNAETPSIAAELITVTGPWIRATAPGQTVSGAFMTLNNGSATTFALTAASFDGASTVEIHETSMADGVMRMRQVSQVDIPANGTAELKPGSFHIMLIGLERELQAGTTETLTLTFSDGSQQTVEVPVGTAGE